MGIGVNELFVIFLLIAIITLPFWIISLVDILKSRFEGNNKIVWLLVVILLYTLGVILYRLIGRSQKITA